MEDIIHKWLPCYGYDVEKMESFLNEMAKEGYILKKNGIFMNRVTFKKTNKRYYYHLVPRQQKEKAETEFMLMQEEKGYIFLGTIHNFYIYAYHRPFQIDVDYKLYNKLKKSVVLDGLGFLLSTLLFLTFEIKASWLLFTIEIGTIPSMVMLFIFVYWIYTLINKYFIYREIEKKYVQGMKREEKEVRFSIIASFSIYLWMAVSIAFVAFVFIYPLDHTTNLPNNSNLPFATLEVVGGERFSFKRNTSFNEYREYSDLLAPVNFEWQETGDYYDEDGKASYVFANIDYHQTIHPILTKRLVREYEFKKLHEDSINYKKMNLNPNDYGLDELIVLKGKNHYVYILSLGNEVVCYDMIWDRQNTSLIESIIPIIKETLEC